MSHKPLPSFPWAKAIVVSTILALSVPTPEACAKSPKANLSRLPADLTSSKLTVRFAPETQEPALITFRELNDSLALVPESAFRLELDRLPGTNVPPELAGKPPGLVIDARQCELVEAEQKPWTNHSQVRRVRYRCPDGDITIEYTLGAEDHFFHKRLQFKPRFKESYLLRRVCLQQYHFAEPPQSLVEFRHGCCVTYFVRRERGGFFFGVEVPLAGKPAKPANSIELGYEVNFRYPEKETYVAEPVFWGAYHRTGILAPPVQEFIKECRNSTNPPDLGESAAMLSMVRTLTHPLPLAVAINYNSWEGGCSRNGYGTGAQAADVEQDKKVLTLAKEQFGEFYTSTLLPWGGLARDMNKLGPDSREPLSSPLLQEMLAWTRQQQIHFDTWAPFKSVCGFTGVNRYCPDYPAWFGKHGNLEYNCPANRPFMEWYTRLLVALMRRDGYTTFANDDYQPRPSTVHPCAATGHDHLPGDTSYGCFVARREVFRTLRRELGPKVLLAACRPQMDSGIWDALYLDHLFTVSEHEQLGGDEVRFRSRVRHFYHFVPSDLDQQYFRPSNGAEIDYLFLSALAVCNRHCVYGLGQDAAQRQRIHRWYDWARAHKDIMIRQVIFLPDWPGHEKCDSYLRLTPDGRGYAFVFNGNEKPVQTTLPLDERAGLRAGNQYGLHTEFAGSDRENTPNPGAGPQAQAGTTNVTLTDHKPQQETFSGPSAVYRDRAVFTVPARGVFLIAIQPERNP